MSSKSAAATNNFLVLNEPTKKVQDYKQMKPNGAVSWVWDHFSVYDPKYNRKFSNPLDWWRDNQYQFSLVLIKDNRTKDRFNN